MKKILLVLTGGTICSFGDEKSENRDVDTDKARLLLTENFKNSKSEFYNQEFEIITKLNTLSENMTISKWNELLDYFKTVDFAKYKGVIVAHGTDTLAYTACLLAMTLSSVKIPIFLVSSHHPLDHKLSNGNINFQYAVELICKDIKPNTYVTYRNDDGKVYLHYGSHLKQCENYSDDFYSKDCMDLEPLNDISTLLIKSEALYNLINYSKGEKENFEGVNSLLDIEKAEIKNRGSGDKLNPLHLNNIGQITSNTIIVKPYVGLDYSRINLDKNIHTIIHGLYHAETACVEISNSKEEYTSNSILYLLDRCNELGIKLFLEPTAEGRNIYASGNFMDEKGAISIYGMTSEMVYVKALIGGALGLRENDLVRFMRKNICGEFVY